MFRKMLLALTGIGAAGVLTVYLLTMPLLRRLPKQSRLNTWDTPSRAFERGMGYCEQQALALQISR